MFHLKQSTQVTIQFFMRDTAGAPVTGINVSSGFTVRASKAAGSFATITPTITEQENGIYTAVLTTTHTNTLGFLWLTFNATGALQATLMFYVSARLQDDLAFPTTTGRSIDVTSGGAVGLDWANIEGQTTGVALSATSILSAGTASAVGSLDAAVLTQINNEVLDVLTADTFAEPASVPAATTSLKNKIGWIFTVLRNKVTQTASTSTLYADDGSTAIATSSTSESGGTVTAGEWS